ncbi:MAG: hypothetical protein ABFS32_07525 [Bacteroidota bacterium]
MPIIITDNDLCYSVYNQEQKIIQSTYRGRFNREQNLSHLRRVMEFSKDHVILGSIVDLSKLRGSFTGMFDTMEHETLPGVKKAGFRYVAYVLSDDILIEHATKKWIDIAKGLSLTIETFGNEEEAENWLIKSINTKEE